MSTFPPTEPWTSPGEVIEGLAAIEGAFRSQGDRRAVFATAYGLITRELVARIDSGRFRDPDWVRRYLVAFGELYRHALAAHLAGASAAIAPAWQVALDASTAGEALVIQDLLLGINAHINHDLPCALEIAGLGGSLDDRYADHTAVNQSLETTTDAVQKRITAYYARGLGVLDDLLLFLDEEIAQIGFQLAREESWQLARRLVEAETQTQRAAVVEAIRRNSTAMARRILAPNGRMPWLISFLGYLEHRFPWPLAIGEAAEAHLLVSAATGVPGTIDELIDGLADLMRKMDLARDRLSIYVSTYLRNTRKVKSALEAGKFQDPAWMMSLDVRFGAMYFAYIEQYRAGAMRGLPRCWLRALKEVALGETMIVQDILLQVIPRVVYDLPIALYAVDMQSNLEARHADYEATYDFFLADLDRVQESLARKYSPIVRVMDAVGGPLDEWISDRLYRQARAVAWQDALRLTEAPDDIARQRIVEELDNRALDAIERSSLSAISFVRSTTALIRRLEDRFPGDWTGEV